MKQSQNQNNKRGRGRGRRQQQNPLTRNYESNGPDVKIRGNTSHIADKYLSLARDALSSGDRVSAENYFQHAEHYLRLIASTKDQQKTASGNAEDQAAENTEQTDEFAKPKKKSRSKRNGKSPKPEQQGDLDAAASESQGKPEHHEEPQENAPKPSGDKEAEHGADAVA